MNEFGFSYPKVDTGYECFIGVGDHLAVGAIASDFCGVLLAKAGLMVPLF